MVFETMRGDMIGHRAVLSDMVVTSYMCLFKLIRNKIRSSVLQSHQSHFKYLLATCGYWLPCQTMLIESVEKGFRLNSKEPYFLKVR